MHNLILSADKVKCKSDEFKCPGYGKCIPLKKVCDKTFHCIGGHDESNDCGMLYFVSFNVFS